MNCSLHRSQFYMHYLNCHPSPVAFIPRGLPAALYLIAIASFEIVFSVLPTTIKLPEASQMIASAPPVELLVPAKVAVHCKVPRSVVIKRSKTVIAQLMDSSLSRFHPLTQTFPLASTQIPTGISA